MVGLETSSFPATIEFLIQLPSGSLLPVRGSSAEPLGLWKKRIIAHCGMAPDSSADFGFSLGSAALDEQKSALANDVNQGDVVALFERASSLQRREMELANQ